jgi:DNA-binding transcriptional LysR family regulator
MIDVALKYFYEAVNCGSIRLASDRLQIAPSAISRQIAQLERRLQTTLLERSRTGIELTEQGKLVSAYIQAAMKDAERLKSTIDELSNLRTGKVIIAAVEAAIGRVLPECIKEFHSRFPGVSVGIRILGSHQVAEAVLKEEADIGIALDAPMRSELLLRTRWAQPLHLILRPEDEALLPEGDVTLPFILALPHVLPDRSFGIRSLVERSAAKQNVKPNPFVETNSLDAAKAVVTAVGGVTILPLEAVYREAAAGTLISRSIVDPIFSRATIDVVTLRQARVSKAADVLLGFVRRSVAGYKS